MSPSRCALCLAIAVPMILVFVGCRHTGRTGGTDIIPEIATGNDMGVLGPMDILMVRVYDEPEISGEFRIDADGTVTFPFLGAVNVSGLTPNETARMLTEGLSDGYLVNPVVSVFVEEANSRQVLVLGNVKKPGPYPYEDGMSIVEALALAGGVDADGAPNLTRVVRKVDGEEQTYNVKVSAITAGSAPNMALLANDIVFVPKSPI